MRVRAAAVPGLHTLHASLWSPAQHHVTLWPAGCDESSTCAERLRSTACGSYARMPQPHPSPASGSPSGAPIPAPHPLSPQEHIKEQIAGIGENIQVRRFARFVLGEGIEKKQVGARQGGAALLGFGAGVCKRRLPPVPPMLPAQ